MSRFAHSWKTGLAMAGALSAALVAGQIASAAETPKVRAGALQTIVDCRKIADGVARLACFDAASAQLDAAEKAGDVVVLDRAQVKEAERSAFGFNFKMPSFLTGGGDGSVKVEPMESLEATLVSARKGPDGKWIFRLPDDAVWVQIDNDEIIRAPKAGSKVEIKRGMVGNYFLSVDGQRSVRAKRQN